MFNHTLNALVDVNTFSGVVLLSRDSETLFSKACGYANRQWNIPNSLDTLYPLASVTKMLTSTAVLQLIDKGLLSLDAGAADILDIESPNLPPDVTLRHLLTHTSGIGDYLEESGVTTDELEDIWETVPNYSMRNLSDFLPLILAKKPYFPPGKRFSYCNAGFIILGLIVEKTAGTRYFDYVSSNIFVPAGMTRTGFYPMDSVVPGLAEGYMRLRDCKGDTLGWKRNIYSVTAPASDGGAISTAEDLSRFLDALRRNALLSPAMTGILLSPKVVKRPDNPVKAMYGYGMSFLMENDEIVYFGHSGGDPGVSAEVYHYPGKNLNLVIISNETDSSWDLFKKLHEVITRC